MIYSVGGGIPRDHGEAMPAFCAHCEAVRMHHHVTLLRALRIAMFPVLPYRRSHWLLCNTCLRGWKVPRGRVAAADALAASTVQWRAGVLDDVAYLEGVRAFVANEPVEVVVPQVSSADLPVSGLAQDVDRRPVGRRLALLWLIRLPAALALGLAIGETIDSLLSEAGQPPAYRVGTCEGCPDDVALESLSVRRDGDDTVFTIGGRFPPLERLDAAPRLVAGDLELLLQVDGDRFTLAGATKAGRPVPNASIGVGIDDERLVLAVDSGLVSTPARFTIGLWDGGGWKGRLPADGELEWTGDGAPAPIIVLPPLTTTTTAAPAVTSTTTTTALPALDVTQPAEVCGVTRTDPPPFLRVNGIEPEAGAVSLEFGEELAAPADAPPFSVAIAILQGDERPGSGDRAVDRIGSLQLWGHWDGGAMHKGIRRWTGARWEQGQDGDADELTVTFASRGFGFEFADLESGDRVAAITAADGGCGALGLDDEQQPALVVP